MLRFVSVKHLLLEPPSIVTCPCRAACFAFNWAILSSERCHCNYW